MNVLSHRLSEHIVNCTDMLLFSFLITSLCLIKKCRYLRERSLFTAGYFSVFFIILLLFWFPLHSYCKISGSPWLPRNNSGSPKQHLEYILKRTKNLTCTSIKRYDISRWNFQKSMTKYFQFCKVKQDVARRTTCACSDKAKLWATQITWVFPDIFADFQIPWVFQVWKN